MQIKRYERQLIIPGFGMKGQRKLKNASVAVVGAGGLGSAVNMYLAAAGIGEMVLIDYDKVEIGNLNRQIMYFEKDIGESKINSAVEKLKKINSGVEITGFEKEINKENAFDLIKGSTCIVDCVDNFRTRYVLNDAALKLNIPFFHGACRAWVGQATTIIPGESACLKCIFPKPPPEEKTPIVGSVAGTIGTIQATEVIKFLLGVQPLLTNRLLMYDSKFLTYDLVHVKRKEDCPSCGGIR